MLPLTRLLGLILVLAVPGKTSARLPALGAALERLAVEGDFSGAVVVREGDKVRFARGYGFADPFAGRLFAPDTPVDSASLAKPLTAAAILLLAQEGRIEVDSAVAGYVSEFPYPEVTVRQLLSHSAGMPGDGDLDPRTNQTNAQMLAAVAQRRLPQTFPAGTAFAYCNACYDALALLIERVTGQSYLAFLHERLGLPRSVGLRPRSLSDWRDRAIGFRRTDNGALEPADSYEGEAFYGSSNLSIGAQALAQWGARWWAGLGGLRTAVTAPAQIAGGVSGLTIGSWFCAPDRRRCHYGGHHEGFRHLLYWDAERRRSVAMVTNNSLDAALQPRLQRALVAFAEGRSEAANSELRRSFGGARPKPGLYRTPQGERVTVAASAGSRLQRLTRRGVTYDVYPVSEVIGYAPGMDLYLTATPGGGLHLLSLYEDVQADPVG